MYNESMNKIWGRTIKDGKIKSDFLLETEKFSYNDLYEYLKIICYNLKIETPIVLKKHQNQFDEYSMTKFTQDDFVDKIDFDSFIIQHFEN